MPDGATETAAEMSSVEKNQVSHRAQAMKKLSQVWQSWLEGENK
ncbi:non-canonical purine NTP pyrophosphatase [Bacillus cereus]